MIIFGIRVRLQNFQVMFVYWGHRTKVTVTGAKKRACVSCSRMVCVRVKGSLVSTHIWIFFFRRIYGEDNTSSSMLSGVPSVNVSVAWNGISVLSGDRFQGNMAQCEWALLKRFTRFTLSGSDDSGNTCDSIVNRWRDLDQNLHKSEDELNNF